MKSYYKMYIIRCEYESNGILADSSIIDVVCAANFEQAFELSFRRNPCFYEFREYIYVSEIKEIGKRDKIEVRSPYPQIRNYIAAQNILDEIDKLNMRDNQTIYQSSFKKRIKWVGLEIFKEIYIKNHSSAKIITEIEKEEQRNLFGI